MARIRYLSLVGSLTAWCLSSSEEVHLQILPKRRAGAAEHDAKIRLADVQHLAHFLAGYAIHLTHPEDLGHARRESVETGLHRLPQLGVAHRLFALGLPIRGAAFGNPVILAIESIRVFVAEELKVGKIRFAPEV